LGTENKEGRPHWKLAGQENTGNGGDQQNTLSHEEMVERVRSFIQQKREIYDEKEWPSEIILF